MRALGFLTFLSASLLLTGCAHSPPHLDQTSSARTIPDLPALKTLYEYRLIEAQSKKAITLNQLTKQLKDKDVIFIGEFHGNQASHLLEAQLQAALYQQRPNQILSMEQFNRDQQAILNRYLEGSIGEKTLIKDAPTWPNYAGSYRPMIEFAKQQFLPVVAANAPAQTVRCVGRQGTDYLQKLSHTERHLIAKDPFHSTPAYNEKFQQFLADQTGPAHAAKNTDEHTPNNRYMAQLLRDNTMAESINQALQQSPKAQVLHLNGAFHSNNALGTVAALKRLNPSLNIAVISPVRVTDPETPTFTQTDLTLGDFIYLIQSQPTDYVQASKRQAAFKAMFTHASQKTCR
uniref:Haem-binding uptake Tiki superfamily ChaN domain-containing protein n=1 Tax=Hydrogenovibrio crunogenus (strain DSM 25203 / XCL-2) TaxID=317025 RepID=Q31JR5_HYDCU